MLKNQPEWKIEETSGNVQRPQGGVAVTRKSFLYIFHNATQRV